MLDYMNDRGMRLDSERVGVLRQYVPRGDDLAGKPAEEQFAAIWTGLPVDPEWNAIVADATQVNVWKPASLSHVSLIQLGRNESWAWGNEVVFGSAFTRAPRTNKSAAERPRRSPTYGSSSNTTRRAIAAAILTSSRFWRSAEAKAWLPQVLKLVRTGDRADEQAPTILF